MNLAALLLTFKKKKSPTYTQLVLPLLPQPPATRRPALGTSLSSWLHASTDTAACGHHWSLASQLPQVPITQVNMVIKPDIQKHRRSYIELHKCAYPKYQSIMQSRHTRHAWLPITTKKCNTRDSYCPHTHSRQPCNTRYLGVWLSTRLNQPGHNTWRFN
jgi:hypothetical protein